MAPPQTLPSQRKSMLTSQPTFISGAKRPRGIFQERGKTKKVLYWWKLYLFSQEQLIANDFLLKRPYLCQYESGLTSLSLWIKLKWQPNIRYMWHWYLAILAVTIKSGAGCHFIATSTRHVRFCLSFLSFNFMDLLEHHFWTSWLKTHCTQDK